MINDRQKADAPGSAQQTPADEQDEHRKELEELDAFLNDFVQTDIAQQAGTALHSPPTAVPPNDTDDETPFDLPIDGVDISALDVDEEPDTVNVTEENAVVASRMQQGSAGNDLFDDTFSAPPKARDTAGRPAAAPGADSAARPLEKIMRFSAMGVAAAAVVLALVAVWFALGVHGQLNDLRAELTALQQRPAPVATDNGMLEQVSHQVQEMQVLIEENKGQLNTTGEATTALAERLAAVEQRLVNQKSTPRATQTTTKAQAAPAKPALKLAPAPAPITTSKASTTPSWAVNVASLSDAKMAAAEQERLRQGGFDVEVQKALMDGRTWYRVRTTGFASREEALVYGDKIRHKYGLSPWVGLDK